MKGRIVKAVVTFLVYMIPLIFLWGIWALIGMIGGSGIPSYRNPFIPKADLPGAIQGFYFGLALLVLLPLLFLLGVWFLSREAKAERPFLKNKSGYGKRGVPEDAKRREVERDERNK